jgi:sugar fermentation stimulation protein A
MREPLLVPHRLPGPPVAATVIVRENRFLARCRLEDGREVEAHVPDRGRLLDLLVPGARALLFACAASATRRTTFSLLACEEPRTGVLVAIDPAGANLRVRALLDRGLVPGVPSGVGIRPEARVGSSRIDFLLNDGSGTVALEVKSVGVVRDGIARFPDAPTERGVRHLEELAAFARRKEGVARVLFVAQRHDARAVAPAEEIDPLFARTLRRLSKVLVLSAVSFEVRPEGFRFLGEIPVVLDG